MVFDQKNKQSNFLFISISYKQLHAEYRCQFLEWMYLSSAAEREEDQAHWTEIIGTEGELHCVTDNKMVLLSKMGKLKMMEWRKMWQLRAAVLQTQTGQEEKSFSNQAGSETLKLHTTLKTDDF